MKGPRRSRRPAKYAGGDVRRGLQGGMSMEHKTQRNRALAPPPQGPSPGGRRELQTNSKKGGKT